MADLSAQFSSEGYPPPALNQFRRGGQSIPGASKPNYTFDPVSLPGSYSLTTTWPNGVIIPPPAVPLAPLGLTIASGDTRIALSWNISAGATSYHVKRALAFGGPFTSVLVSVTGLTTIDTAVTNGTTYYYVVSALNALGESSNSLPASATPAPVDMTAIKISFVGDSIPNDQGQSLGAPANLVAPLLSTALSGRPVTMGVNRCHNGYSTSYALTDTVNPIDADVAACLAVNTTHVMGNYGINNTRDNLTTTKATFLSEYAQIIAKYTVAGMKFIINAPTYAAFTPESEVLLRSFLSGLGSLANGVNVFMGDEGEGYVSGATHPDWLFDGVHPNNDGIMAYVNAWVAGAADALTPFVGLPVVINPDGSLNSSGFANYYANVSPKAWSARLGPTADPSLVISTHLYTPTPNFNKTVYDLLGLGSEVRINANIGGTPDIRPIYTQGAIYPYEWGPPHPSFEPGANTIRYGLPSAATDINDPANQGNPTLSPAQMLTYNRQQWMEVGNGYFQLVGDSDFYSDYGTLAFVAKNRINLCGVDRIGTTASYSRCFAVSPRRNDGGFPAGSEAWTLYHNLFLRGHPYGAVLDNEGNLASHVISMARARFVNCQEALVLDNKGLLTTTKGPTTRDDPGANPLAYPLPEYRFPSGEEAVFVAISTMAEFALVIVHDHNLQVSKAVLFALQGYAQAGHSMLYYGLGNEGCFSGIRRIGERVLTMKFATTAAIATDAVLKPTPEWVGNPLSNQGTRDSIRGGGPDNAQDYCSFGRKGYFAVGGLQEDKIEIYDFSLYIEELFQKYTAHDQTAWDATFAAMNAGTFPPPFSGAGDSVRLDLAPTLMHSEMVLKPTCMLASGNITPNPFIAMEWGDWDKLLVGTQSGRVEAVNMASIMDRMQHHGTYWQYGPDNFRGGFQIGPTGSNITEMQWSRYQQDNYYGLVAGTGVMRNTGSHVAENPSEFLNTVHICCRAARTVYSVCTRYDIGSGQVLGVPYRTIQDDRILDPVSASLSTRLMIMQICDFNGNAIHSIQIGGVGRGEFRDGNRGNALVSPAIYFPPNPDDLTQTWSYAGSMTVPHPFTCSADNIN